MRFNDRFNNGEANPRPLFGSRSRLPEMIKNFGLLIFRYTRATIGHRDIDKLLIATNFDHDFAMTRTKFDRIADEVRQHPHDTLTIKKCEYRRINRIKLQAN